MVASLIMAGLGSAVAAQSASAATPTDVAGQPSPFGAASYYGAPANPTSPIVGIAPTSDGKGYWLVAANGGVFSYGDAHFYGSTGGITLNKPIVGIAATPSGGGYWLVASDGGVFSYGDAHFYGSTGGITLNKPVVGIAATHDGNGYWLVASDGGVFSYGDAHFYGSTGNITLNKPVVGIAATHDGNGYWLVASDGGIFSYGDAHFYGSTGNITLAQPIVGMAVSETGNGYWLAASDGGIFNYGDAHFYGSMGGSALANPIIGIAPADAGTGYWLLPTTPAEAASRQGGPTITLVEGDSGPQVLSLQNDLTSLGYWNGPADGVFGDATLQAVWALQKAAGLPRTGVVNAATETALANGVRPTPLPASGYVIEINLSNDLLMFVNNGQLEWVINTSTGGGYTYTSQGVTSVAITPTGIFHTYRVIDGIDVAPLGTLYRPRFFTGGYAIHGDSIVPPYPVSHGCARVSNEAIDWIWANNIDPIGTEVWVY
jgi:peptidoglycan hydrolase-like protein with peptidoglycan-binding domain